MNFEEAGAALRAEREKRQISIEEVANQLKIGRRQIRALENGDIASLPHPAYAKGFIRSYAAWLGLRPEDLRMQKSEAEAGEKENLEIPGPNQRSSHAGCWIVLFLLCLCGGFYYAWQENFWGLLEKKEAEKTVITNELPTANEFLDKKESGTKEETPAVKPEETPVNEPAVAPVELPPTPPVTQAREEEKSEPPAQTAETRPAEETTSQPAAEVEEEIQAVPENHKLIITAIEECWVHSNSDKTDTRQFSLRKGDTFALTFTESLELKLGNAGGVRLRYDGQDLPPAGTSGQVKTLVFPPRESNE